MSSLSDHISELISYGIKTELLDPAEEIYTRNLLLDLFKENEYVESENRREDAKLHEILDALL